MKFSCEKYLLQTACLTASRAAASKSPIQALEGLLIEAGADVKVTGYDLKKGIYTNIGANVTQPGSIVVNARLFGDIIRKLPDGIVVIATENLNVNVTCGKSSFNIMGISPEEYPEMPDIDKQDDIQIAERLLRSMINQTNFAVATNESRPIYTGALFEAEGDSLTIVAIDGYRLAKRSEQLDAAREKDVRFVVPGTTLSDVERICEDKDEPVHIAVGSKHVAFSIGETVVISRRLEGEFLNYKKSIPENFRYILKIERSEFMAVIDRVSLIISEKNSNPVHLVLNDGSIECSCVTPIGKAEDVCLCEGSGDGLEVGFNDRYMMDALKASGKDELYLCMNTASSPCIIKAADGTESFIYMILPVRLRAND